VLIPGIQGRWEYMRSTVDALARRFRVLTFSLAGGDVESATAQTLAALNDARVDRAVVVGVSFGGVAALRFAANHPDRTLALVLASTPGPDWHLSERHDRYARHPWLGGPLLLAETPRRLQPEVRAALPSRAARRRFAIQAAKTFVTAPVSFTKMAGRARAMERADRAGDALRVSVPTLVITGEPALDHVVPAEGTSAYADRIRGAAYAMIPRTGHLGAMTRPDEFTTTIAAFVARLEHSRSQTHGTP
jgi:pimeloyl-ACP methyl ester carboxylesterase